MKMLLAIASVFAFVLPVCPSVAQPVVLDQSYDAFADGASGGLTIFQDTAIAQTFEVGVTGTLVQLDLQVQKDSDATGDLIISILGVDALGIPDISQNLGTIFVRPDSIPVRDFNNAVFTSFDLSSLGISVVAGDVLAFQTEYGATDLRGYFNFQAFTGVGYAGGGSSVRASSDPFVSVNPFGDGGFQTFVQIPEPAALGSFALGGLILLGRRR